MGKDCLFVQERVLLLVESAVEIVFKALCFLTLEKVVSLNGIQPSMTLHLKKNVLVPLGSTSHECSYLFRLIVLDNFCMVDF